MHWKLLSDQEPMLLTRLGCILFNFLELDVFTMHVTAGTPVDLKSDRS